LYDKFSCDNDKGTVRDESRKEDLNSVCILNTAVTIKTTGKNDNNGREKWEDKLIKN
jgi:hypothetical protein